jgi:arylsulfatase A-like enzyme
MAENGVLFENALATNPETLPSHASILTGLYPTAHGVRSNGRFRLGDQHVLVSEVLSENGWRTAAFVASTVLGSRYGLAQGFEVYDTPSRDQSGRLDRTGDEVVTAAIAWLRTLTPGERFFAWVHLYDPHIPYRAPAYWRSKFVDPYTGEIAYADAMVARLMRHLEVSGLDRNLVTIVTSDHGEGLGEHGEMTHGMLIYQSTMHVPLILSGPGLATRRGARIANPVTLSQLAPSILAWAGLSRNSLPEAKLPLLLDEDPPQAIYLESLYPFFSRGYAAYRGLVADGYKLVRGHHHELYSLARDPSEGNDLAAINSGLTDQLDARLDELVAEFPPLERAESVELSEAEREQLAELGYVVPRTEADDPFDASLPDATLGLVNLQLVANAIATLDEARRLMAPDPGRTDAQDRERRHQALAELGSLREALEHEFAANPRNSVVARHLAHCLVLLGAFSAAIPILEERIAAVPLEAETRFLLALAYEGVGRSRAAREQVERAIATGTPQPLFFEWMIEFYRREGNATEALRWAERYARESDLDERGRALHLLNQVRSEFPDTASADAAPAKRVESPTESSRSR